MKSDSVPVIETRLINSHKLNGKVHTNGVWDYDQRTYKHFTLKIWQLKYEDLKNFIACYNPENLH